MFYVYILRGTRYYVGYTNNIAARISQHQNGKVVSTLRYGKLTLIGYFICGTKKEAMDLEKEIKKSKNIKRWVVSTGFEPAK